MLRNQEYQVRWLSKDRRERCKKDGTLASAMLLTSLNGFMIIEPKGSHFGDGPVLSREDADYELQEVWCTESNVKLKEARRLLGLSVKQTPVLVG